MTRVKICGNTNLLDARQAIEAGADLLGFIFYAKSPRHISVGDARSISRAVRGRAILVGVFVNEPADVVDAVLAEAELDLAQLHGDEDPATVAALAGRGYKAMKRAEIGGSGPDAYVAAGTTLSHLPQLLLDADHATLFGGTGLRADASLAVRLSRHCRLLLAGGLNPENVAEAIATVVPWGVDVASGVEASPGIKDPDKVRRFIAAARGANPPSTG